MGKDIWTVEPKMITDLIHVCDPHNFGGHKKLTAIIVLLRLGIALLHLYRYNKALFPALLSPNISRYHDSQSDLGNYFGRHPVHWYIHYSGCFPMPPNKLLLETLGW